MAVSLPLPQTPSATICILFPENFKEGANLYDLHIFCMALLYQICSWSRRVVVVLSARLCSRKVWHSPLLGKHWVVKSCICPWPCGFECNCPQFLVPDVGCHTSSLVSLHLYAQSNKKDIRLEMNGLMAWLCAPPGFPLTSFIKARRCSASEHKHKLNLFAN